MVSAVALRAQIEASLAQRIPAALSPVPRVQRPTVPTGIPTVDALLGGGLPIAAISEIVGAECSGRTSLALSFLTQITQQERVCAWIDVTDSLEPKSAAACGVDLTRLLWVRCGETLQGRPRKCMARIDATTHGGSVPEPPGTFTPRCYEPVPKIRPSRSAIHRVELLPEKRNVSAQKPGKTIWKRLEQALRTVDLLLHTGGFGAMVLDLGGVAPEYALRVPLASWFRFRQAAERTQTTLVLLTQRACAKSCASVVLQTSYAGRDADGKTLLSGLHFQVELLHRHKIESFLPDAIPRKSPASDHATWSNRMAWAGRR